MLTISKNRKIPVNDIRYLQLTTIRCGMFGWVGCVTVGGALNPWPEFMIDYYMWRVVWRARGWNGRNRLSLGSWLPSFKNRVLFCFCVSYLLNLITERKRNKSFLIVIYTHKNLYIDYSIRDQNHTIYINYSSKNKTKKKLLKVGRSPTRLEKRHDREQHLIHLTRNVKKKLIK